MEYKIACLDGWFKGDRVLVEQQLGLEEQTYIRLDLDLTLTLALALTLTLTLTLPVALALTLTLALEIPSTLFFLTLPLASKLV